MSSSKLSSCCWQERMGNRGEEGLEEYDGEMEKRCAVSLTLGLGNGQISVSAIVPLPKGVAFGPWKRPQRPTARL
ncbi:hypothetical protein EGR_09252 [Echinococcus granulosus]|uniref:Uncharacterized protein n=1 Tax=Echinococcus granulosus TaxID=6210 RepID=W6U460_ECHGR|nr:hypothetical protein EGR_09252 [Echinococcus granulosus]EUB55895.1 hypothetical protein EGR_09252 [Echinococcus granulosus]